MKATEQKLVEDRGPGETFALPAEWTVFGPVGWDSPEPDFAAMQTPPAELVIAGERLPSRKAAFDAEHRLDLGALLGGPEEGKTAYLLANCVVDREMEVTLGSGADWWMKWWVKGERSELANLANDML